MPRSGFLFTIEAVGASRAGDVLTAAGEGDDLRAFTVQQELRILALTGGLGE